MQKKTFSVYEITNYIKNLLCNDFILENVNIIGELTSYNHKGYYHYFTLTDKSKNNSIIDCLISDINYKNSGFNMKIGTEIKISGKINVYEKTGRYNILVNNFIPYGIANNYQNFLQMKNKLEKLGFFDIKHKKIFPHCKKIGIITSAKGAAIQDFKSILNRRAPIIEIEIFDCMVQGDKAVKSIINGIEYFEKQNDIDCIVISRGGGSKEDLMIFNDENLAYRIFHCNLPILSAVGHEIDTTICDLVADKRVATPSEAAEFLSEYFVKYTEFLKNVPERINNILTIKLSNTQKQLNYISPKKLNENLIYKINTNQKELKNIFNNMLNHLNYNINNYHNQLNSNIRIINSLNYNNIIKKGYAIIENEKHKICDNLDDLKKDDILYIKTKNKKIKVKIINMEDI